MELKDKVLACVQAKGPVIPMQVAKDIGKDTFYAGAILSELLASKVIKISHAKVGSTPVYYMPGQEEKLSMLYNGLPQKEKEAYNLLKEKRKIKDRELEPAHRVAMRTIKDFAIPSYDAQQQIVWSWYLTKAEQQKEALQQTVAPFQVQVKQQSTMIPQTVLEATKLMQPPERQSHTLLTQPVQQIRKKEEPRPQEKAAPAEKSDFLFAVRQYLQNNHIQIIEEKVIKKNKEYEVVVKVPSNVGLLDYIVLARNKKKIADADLSLAYNHSQAKKMPIMFLTNGELSRKAVDYKEKNLKGFMTVKKL